MSYGIRVTTRHGAHLWVTHADGTFSSGHPAQAKKFDSREQATGWLKRHPNWIQSRDWYGQTYSIEAI